MGRGLLWSPVPSLNSPFGHTSWLLPPFFSAPLQHGALLHIAVPCSGWGPLLGPSVRLPVFVRLSEVEREAGTMETPGTGDRPGRGGRLG